MFDPISMGLSLGTGLLSGFLGSRAASSAARQQQEAAAQALAYQQQAQRDATGRMDSALATARGDQLNALNMARTGYGDALAGARGDIQSALNYTVPNQRLTAQTSVNYLQPYMNMGSNAANTLTGMYSGGRVDPSSFNASPDYNWRFSEGERALGNLQRARGGFQGGNATLDTIKYAQGAASQEFGNYFDRLMRMSGAGQQAAGQAGQNVIGVERNIGNDVLGAYTNMANQGLNANQALSGNILQTYGNIANQGVNSANNYANVLMQGANQAGNYITGAGQAGAAGTVGAANAWSQGIGGGVNNGLFLNAYNNRNAGGGGSAFSSGAAPTNYLMNYVGGANGPGGSLIYGPGF